MQKENKVKLEGEGENIEKFQKLFENRTEFTDRELENINEKIKDISAEKLAKEKFDELLKKYQCNGKEDIKKNFPLIIDFALSYEQKIHMAGSYHLNKSRRNLKSRLDLLRENKNKKEEEYVKNILSKIDVALQDDLKKLAENYREQIKKEIAEFLFAYYPPCKLNIEVDGNKQKIVEIKEKIVQYAFHFYSTQTILNSIEHYVEIFNLGMRLAK